MPVDIGKLDHDRSVGPRGVRPKHMCGIFRHERFIYSHPVGFQRDSTQHEVEWVLSLYTCHLQFSAILKHSDTASRLIGPDIGKHYIAVGLIAGQIGFSEGCVVIDTQLRS